MSDSYLNDYQKVLQAFTAKEMSRIVQVKRFFEWYEADPEFRESVNCGEISAFQENRLKEIGVSFPVEEMALLWEHPEVMNDFFCKTSDVPSEHTASRAEKIMGKFPLLQLWHRFIHVRYNQFKKVCAQRFSVPENPRFDAWRKRRIASCESELGAFNHKIDHPTLALELCDGCSVQCWFCSFSAKRLKSVLDYSENKAYFRKIVQTCVDLFGPGAAGMALLYYGTEPYDNPNYIEYMQDFAKISGSTVCTATAVCTDEKWIKDLITHYRGYQQPWPRLSVLSNNVLHKIHDRHSPEELRDVSMVMQMKESQRQKVSGGRIFDSKGDMRERNSTNYLKDIIPQGSIACVTGFLINLVRKEIKLVSPCYTSKSWPYGYRVFDQVQFETADEFQGVMMDMMNRNMPDTPPPQMPFRLRDDLIFNPLENGFDLVCPAYSDSSYPS